MEDREVARMQFITYLKQWIRTGFITGTLIGVIVFTLSIFNVSPSIELFSHEFSGIFSVIIILIVFPIQFTILGFLWGLISFLPYKLIERLTGLIFK